MNHVGFRGGADADHHYRAGAVRHGAISHTLSASGVWMGEPLNVSGDLLPPEPMYEASRLLDLTDNLGDWGVACPPTDDGR